MTNIDPISLLHNAFPELNEEDIATLNQAADSQCYAAGTDILLEGETGTILFVLGSGQADILVHANDHEILIDSVGPNSYFGEMAFLGETTRTATIRATTDCHVLAIDEKDFMPIARANPNLLRNLLRQIVGHLRRNDQAVISELNAKNRDLEQAYADLAEQEELRTKFIATLSHEIRTPLTSVRGFLGLITQGALQGDSLRVAIESISRNVERMVGLTNDLLLMYEMHPTSMEFSYVDLADVLIEALNDARTALNGNPTGVKLDIAPNLPQLYADRRALTLAVRALTENAFKFNPEQLPISIRAATNGNNEITITVQDKGIGIPPADQSRIFEPFVRLEKEGSQYLFPGLGVGLTIARFVVERHNGRIDVSSTPGQGSTFTIHLPQTS
ncbi:MAG: HAMP domain-containing histidine kinase [Ardenticatenaceae bacterium]|nr:HAMP domain-containing histidine kinase [Ardenticatenaceae bacterium]MCB9443158.1 HAMP domain-containing histidine kinase [Ardenticatenaceae bacterium]